MDKEITGSIFKFGDHVNTDYIIPGKYLMNVTDPEELATHVMEDLDPNFSDKVKQGDVIAAGENFGCGSSREEAPAVIKDGGVSLVLAESFARIFYRNAVNIGLPILECDTDKLRQGDEVSVNLESGIVEVKDRKEKLKVKPLPSAMRRILEDGGLVAHLNEHGEFSLD